MARLIFDAANQYDDSAFTYDGLPIGGNTPWVWPVGHDIPDLSKKSRLYDEPGWLSTPGVRV
jgi:hypothetical protein